MNTYSLATIILSLAVLISYINQRFIKVQSSIAIMISSLLLSVVLIALHHSGFATFADQTETLIVNTNFHALLINGMLGFLLFAGALTIDFEALKAHKWEIATLASVGTITSTFLIAICIFYTLPLVDLHLPFLYCLLFGALISPTDPIAVLATFKQIGAPRSIVACLGGESLFNDGVGIVIFITVYQLTFGNTAVTWQNVSLIFLEQAIGGMVYGGLLGFGIFALIQKSNTAQNAILLTIMIATGGYNLAQMLNISGPLAMVVAGMYIGNKLHHKTNMQHLNLALNLFWEIIDELLNAILFLLMGFELLAIHNGAAPLQISVLAIPVILLVRLLTVAIPIKLFNIYDRHPYTITLLTWGGLRGGLALALALALPPSDYRGLILAMTYGVVAFSVIVQGLTIKPLAQRAKKR